MEGCMTDFAFSKLIFNKLLNSGADCCSMCVHCPPADEDRLCEGLKHDVPDDDICYEGVRAYFERLKEVLQG